MLSATLDAGILRKFYPNFELYSLLLNGLLIVVSNNHVTLLLY